MEYHHNSEFVHRARSLRKKMTKEENLLWYRFLRGYIPRFRRQEIIGDSIVDFYCVEAKIAIELDGSQHYTARGIKRDLIRTEMIKQFDIEVLRIPNNFVLERFESVCEFIDQIITQRIAANSAPGGGAVGAAD